MDQEFTVDKLGIKATLIKINSRGNIRYDWAVEDEKNAGASCLICNHYKYNHANYKTLDGKFVHICLFRAPKFIDVTNEMNKGLNRSCFSFSRREIR